MSLLIPCEFGPTNPRQSIVLDCEEGDIHLDLTAVTDPEFRCITLSAPEAREVACALLHYAQEVSR